jgi:hypothetical protein
MKKILIGLIILFMIIGFADSVRYPAGYLSGNLDLNGKLISNGTITSTYHVGDLINTGYGLKNTSNKILINLTANKGLEFGTTTAAGSLQIKLDGTTLQLGSSGIKVNPDLVLTTATVNGKLLSNVMIVSIDIPSSPVDGTIFIAPFACKVIDIVEAHEVAQNATYPNTGSVTLYKATNGQNAGAGVVLHNTTMWLNSSANTPQGPTLNDATGATTLASAGRVVANFNGTMTTYAGGCITLQIQKL